MKKYEKYSHGSFPSMLDVDPAELDGTVIVGSCFYQQTPYSDVFPKLPDGGRCQLQDCNVDGCNLTDGYECTGTTTNKHFLTQKDGEYWIVDKALNPVEPRDKNRFTTLKLSTDPANITAEQLDEPITRAMDPEIIRAKARAAVLADESAIAALVDAQVEIVKADMVVKTGAVVVADITARKVL